MKKLIENKTAAGMMDDGPRFMYGNTKTYMTYARRMADKLGMSVEDWLLDIDKEFELHDTDGILDTVSYFPTGDAGAFKHGTDYHPDEDSKEAYNLWIAHAERLATIANDVNVVDDLGAKQSIIEPAEPAEPEIVVESLNEIGDLNERVNEIGDASAATYPFKIATDEVYPVERNDGKVFKFGKRVYTFTTDSDLQYEVELTYKVGVREHAGSDALQSVSVQFSADGSYNDETNRGEMFRVMATIVTIMKKSREDEPFDMIEFTTYPKDDYDSSENPVRRKLYTQYITKIFPNVRVKRGGNSLTTIAYLSEDILKDNIDDTNFSDVEIREEQDPDIDNDDLIQVEDVVDEDTLIDPHPDEDADGNKYDFLPDDEIEESTHVPEFVYHGTSFENAQEILKNGFKDANNPYNAMSFTDDPHEAAEYGEVVLKVKVKDGAVNQGEDGVDKLTGELMYQKQDVIPIEIMESGHYHSVDGGYKKYIRDHIGELGITELAAIWEDQLLDEHYGIMDDEIELLVEANMLNILGEKTYKDLRRDAPNYLRVRDKSKKTPGSRYQFIDKENVIHFKTPSHTKVGVIYDQQVKLLDLDNLIQQHSGIKKPIEIVRMALEGDIEVHCTDPSWLYWGWKYMGTKDKYAIEPEPRYPKIRNPNLRGSICKHLDNVLFILPFQNTKILKDLQKQGRL